jgi:hypothetical protein
MIIILLAIIIGIILLIISNSFSFNENFIDTNTNIITFTEIDGLLIKNYKINSFYSLYNNNLMELFINNDIIKINIPLNYLVIIKYSFKNDISKISKIIKLSHGSYDINKFTSDKIITQIDIKNMIKYNNELLAISNVNIPMYLDTDLYNSHRPELYY